MNIIDIDMYLLYDTICVLFKALGYTVGLTICFVAGFYIGTIAREYVDQSDDK